jgi:uncharacterized membrane protein
MAKILEILGTVAGMIPIVFALINAFEVPGWGPQKKQAVLDAVGSFYDSLGITFIAKDKLLAIVGGLVDLIVTFYNLVGWFKNSNPIVNS